MDGIEDVCLRVLSVSLPYSNKCELWEKHTLQL